MKIKLDETNKQALQAIIGGHDIEIFKSHGWELVEDITTVNPLSLPNWTFRRAVEWKEVCYKSLINSQLVVKLHDLDAPDFAIGPLADINLSMHSEAPYISLNRTYWEDIDFNYRLKQVVSDETLSELTEGGWFLHTYHSFYLEDPKDTALYHVVVLIGPQNGYTL